MTTDSSPPPGAAEPRPPGSLPDFLIIGAQKSGTTSLFGYLSRHPRIVPAVRKEVHFFDLNWERGPDWYRGFFPPAAQLDDRRLTGEATPYLLFHPLCPGRVLRIVPDVKLVALLRNPVARAYSHWRHEQRLGFESLGFTEALAAEEERLGRAGDWHAHQHYSYVSRGRYAGQLRRWFELFPRERFFITAAERLFADPARITNDLVTWMGLEPFELPEWPALYAGGPAPPIEPEVAARLADHFRPHNRELYALLGQDLGWD